MVTNLECWNCIAKASYLLHIFSKINIVTLKSVTSRQINDMNHVLCNTLDQYYIVIAFFKNKTSKEKTQNYVVISYIEEDF